MLNLYHERPHLQGLLASLSNVRKDKSAKQTHLPPAHLLAGSCLCPCLLHHAPCRALHHDLAPCSVKCSTLRGDAGYGAVPAFNGRVKQSTKALPPSKLPLPAIPTLLLSLPPLPSIHAIPCPHKLSTLPLNSYTPLWRERDPPSLTCGQCEGALPRAPCLCPCLPHGSPPCPCVSHGQRRPCHLDHPCMQCRAGVKLAMIVVTEVRATL